MNLDTRLKTWTSETATPPPGTSSMAFSFRLFTYNITPSQQIELINEMDHDVTVNGIVPRVRTLRSGDRTPNVTPFAQNIIPLHCDRGSIPFQETLRKFRIPNQFISIHRRIIISSTTALVYVGRETHVPRHIHLHVSPIRKVIRIQIRILLQIVPGMLVVDVAIHSYLK